MLAYNADVKCKPHTYLLIIQLPVSKEYNKITDDEVVYYMN